MEGGINEYWLRVMEATSYIQYTQTFSSTTMYRYVHTVLIYILGFICNQARCIYIYEIMELCTVYDS